MEGTQGTKTVWSITFCIDGASIISGSDDKSVQVWDTLTGAELKVLEGHKGAVWSIAFSTDGSHIFSDSEDNSVQVWDASTGATMHPRTD